MTTTINNEHKKLNVPNLRFPEFQGEWEKCKVSDLLDFYSTNSLSWDKLEYGTTNIQNLHYGLIHVGLPTMVDIEKDNLPNIIDGNVPKNYELCKEGDIVFADASEDTNEVAKAVEYYNLNGKKVVCGLHTIHGRDNKNKTVVGYKGYAFSSMSFHHQIRRIAQGTKIYSINTKNFSECYVGIPSKEEQQKIADLLRLIDERIATQNKIIEKLQSLIRGLSDNIHRDIKGETVCFSGVGEAYSGLSGKSGDDFGDGEPFITYMNVYQNTYISEKDYEFVQIAPNERQNCVQYGDALFTLSSETPEEVGIGAVYLGNTQKLYLNSFCFGIHFYDERVLPQYLAHFISSFSFRKAIYPLAQGSTRFNLQKNDFMKMKFVLPTLEEQERIAKTLDALHYCMANEKSLLEQYILLKRYLLSQMFI